eukprot:2627607-Prymnesium_polylepis.1
MPVEDTLKVLPRHAVVVEASHQDEGGVGRCQELRPIESEELCEVPHVHRDVLHGRAAILSI